MLYLIRLSFSIALGSSQAFHGTALPIPCAEPSERGKALLAQSRELFRNLADSSEKGLRERGFLLALLEMARESRARGWEEGPFRLLRPFVEWPCSHFCAVAATSLSVLVGQYFERFSTKMCCLEDLRPYLDALTPSERAAFRDVMTAIADGTIDLVCQFFGLGSALLSVLT